MRLLYEFPIVEVVVLLREGEDHRVVGREDDGDFFLFHEFGEDLHDPAPGLLVEAPRRFVADDHFGVFGKRSCDGDPLLLSAAELGGFFLSVLPEADRCERLFDPLCDLRLIQVLPPQEVFDVLFGGEDGDQMELLKDEADVVLAQGVLPLFGQGGVGSVLKKNLPLLQRLDHAQQVEQGRFARSGRSGDGDERLCRDVERQVT